MALANLSFEPGQLLAHGKMVWELERSCTRVLTGSFFESFDTAAPEPLVQTLGLDWEEADWIVDIAHILEQMLGIKLESSYETLQTLESPEQFSYLHEKLPESGWLPVGADIKQLLGLVEVFKTNCQAYYASSPKIYPTRISLFKAKEMQTVSEIETQLTDLTQSMRQENTWDWQTSAKDAVDIHQVPGDHFTMMAKPYRLSEKSKSSDLTGF